MAHDEERRNLPGIKASDMAMYERNVLYNPEKAVFVGGMAQKAAFAGIIYRRVGGFSVAPLISGPQFKALLAKLFRQKTITAPMFGHAVDQVNNSLGRSGRSPASKKKLCPIVGFYPEGRFIHGPIMI
jgi:hypothetical protein